MNRIMYMNKMLNRIRSAMRQPSGTDHVDSTLCISSTTNSTNMSTRANTVNNNKINEEIDNTKNKKMKSVEKHS